MQTCQKTHDDVSMPAVDYLSFHSLSFIAFSCRMSVPQRCKTRPAALHKRVHIRSPSPHRRRHRHVLVRVLIAVCPKTRHHLPGHPLLPPSSDDPGARDTSVEEHGAQLRCAAGERVERHRKRDRVAGGVQHPLACGHTECGTNVTVGKGVYRETCVQ